MKKAILLVWCIFSTYLLVMSQGQVDKSNEVTLYLKKGMIIRGSIINQIPGESITIENQRGDTLFIRDGQIKKYHMWDPQVENVKISKTYDFSEKGFYQASTLGLILNTVSSEDGGLTGFEMTASAGALLNRYFGLGAGVGADFYHPNVGEMTFPIFFEMRGYLVKQPSSPFYVVRSGYGFAFKNEDLGIVDATGGWMLNPAVGWRFGDGGGLKMTFDLGLKFQKASFSYRNGRERSTAELIYKRLSMRLGFLF